MENNHNDRLDALWQYPLFEAFANRRAHRFGLGTELAQTPFPFKSEKEPVPLSELESAALCWAGYGVTGLINADLECSTNTFMNWQGRTVPAPCNDQHNDLLFINDEGVFLYRPKPATQTREIAGAGDRAKILESYREGTVQMFEGRPDIPPAALLRMNVWDFNKPGQTTFFPVLDLTYEIINGLFVYFCDDHYCIIDDLKGGKPAGVQKWVDSGYLSGPTVPLTFHETSIATFIGGIGHYMVQNMHLAATAMGAGSFVWGGYVPLVLLGGTPFARGLGFRFTSDKRGMPVAVGKDGFIEPLVPPYVKNMDEAVDRVVEYKFGKEGLFSQGYQGERAFRDRSMVSGMQVPDEEGIACVKAFCNYIYDTYGRFPSLIDPIALPAAVTVHHLDFDFYDKYYKEGAVSQHQRDHMGVWHS
jgi:hypothetical protein